MTQEIVLTAGAHKLDFQLSSTVRLTEVVVTGVAQATDQKKLTIGVQRLNAEAISQVVGTSPIAALAGKVSGARIAMAVASLARSRRSACAGRRTSEWATARRSSSSTASSPRSTPPDIDASDVENIEVLKGAAAASFYGSDAANGVINITTKRGKGGAEGVVQVRTRSEGERAPWNISFR